jgi:hypothetical protein
MLKGCGAAAGLLTMLLATSSSAQAPHEHAVPPLASANFGWQTGIADWQQPPAGHGHGPIKPHPQHPYVSNAEGGRTGRQPTLRIGDDTDPVLKPWAAKVIRDSNEESLTGSRAVPVAAQARCFPGGVPGQLLFPFEPMYFIQLDKVIYMMWQRDQHVRRIYLNQAHSRNVKPSWNGESVGRYENGELVIDTIGVKEHEFGFVDNWRTPHTKDMHVVERWRVVDNGKAIEATVTVDDPGAFKQPWTGRARWEKVDRGKMLESICAENNGGFETLFNLREYRMPEAKTPDF